jgi:hypothetical protein
MLLTPELIRHLWQLKTIVFLHWYLICSVPLEAKSPKCDKILVEPVGHFLRFSHLSDPCFSSKKMLHLLLKKMFVFIAKFKLFGAEMHVA